MWDCSLLLVMCLLLVMYLLLVMWREVLCRAGEVCRREREWYLIWMSKLGESLIWPYEPLNQNIFDQISQRRNQHTCDYRKGCRRWSSGGMIRWHEREHRWGFVIDRNGPPEGLLLLECKLIVGLGEGTVGCCRPGLE